MRARRVDVTQADIVKALERVGCRVWIVNGALDLVVLREPNHITLIDAKGASGKRTKTQQSMLQDGWPINFCRTPEEALVAVGLHPRMVDMIEVAKAKGARMLNIALALLSIAVICLAGVTMNQYLAQGKVQKAIQEAKTACHAERGTWVKVDNEPWRCLKREKE